MTIKFIPKAIFSFLIISLLAACAPAVTLPPPQESTATFPPLPEPTVAQPLETPIPLELATPTPPPPRTKYILNTIIDYDAKNVNVDQTIFYSNLTGNQLSAIVIAVVPNLWSGSFNLTSLTINGEAVTTSTLNGQRLDIPLASILEAGEVLEIQLQYTLSLPFIEPNNPNVSRPQIFGYTQRQLNLTDWYPFVVPYINGEWILYEPWAYGEHLVYDIADYEVNVRFVDLAIPPIVAASGFAEQHEGFTRYTIYSARAFVISASREYQVASTQVGDITIYSYYFPFFETPGQAILETTVQAVQVFSQKFGPYPHKSLSVVMADFKDSMEFSALYFHSPLYYNQYDGTPMNYLTYIGVHETAHQWWFEQVASNQAQHPWLDESLSTYSERIYYETLYPDLVQGWWTYRVNFFQPQGFIDIPVYEGQGFESYRISVYLNGTHFFEDLRTRIGDEAFFNFLQDYLNRGKNRIVTPEEFFQILRMNTSADISDLLNQYFRNVYQ
jgi:hypothetical protein